MSQDPRKTAEELNELWTRERIPILDTAGKKYAILSDLHFGDGGGADDFFQNRSAMVNALQHYLDNDFTLILLGDIEEFWQFDLVEVFRVYGQSIYTKLNQLHEDGRLYRVYGNHDIDWRLHDPILGLKNAPEVAVEALKMRDAKGDVRVLLVHGHQGNTESDRYAWISRLLVRRLWKPVEPFAAKIGLYPRPDATKSRVTKAYEKVLYDWAKSSKTLLICGHSHRAIFASRTFIDKLEEKLSTTTNKATIKKLKEQIKAEKGKGRKIQSLEDSGKPVPCYFNTGCGLYTSGITALEIADTKMRLVKWVTSPSPGGEKVTLEDGSDGNGEGKPLSEFIDAIDRASS